MRLSTAVTQSEFPRGEHAAGILLWSHHTWEIFCWNSHVYFKTGQSTAWSQWAIVWWLQNISPIPSWQEVPEWGEHPLIAWAICSPTTEKPIAELFCSLTPHPHFCCWALNQLRHLAPGCTSSHEKGLSNNIIILFVQRHDSCIILAWFPENTKIITSLVSTAHVCAPVLTLETTSDSWSDLTKERSQRYAPAGVREIGAEERYEAHSWWGKKAQVQHLPFQTKKDLQERLSSSLLKKWTCGKKASLFSWKI